MHANIISGIGGLHPIAVALVLRMASLCDYSKKHGYT